MHRGCGETVSRWPLSSLSISGLGLASTLNTCIQYRCEKFCIPCLPIFRSGENDDIIPATPLATIIHVSTFEMKNTHANERSVYPCHRVMKHFCIHPRPATEGRDLHLLANLKRRLVLALSGRSGRPRFYWIVFLSNPRVCRTAPRSANHNFFRSLGSLI